MDHAAAEMFRLWSLFDPGKRRASLDAGRYSSRALIAGADSRVRSAFRSTLQRAPYFGAPPVAPEVLCVEDLTAAIARAEAVIRAVRRESTPAPPAVAFDDAGPSGTQRIAALTAAEAERVLRSDSILVLDEYAFNYPAGRLDTFLLPEERATPGRRVVARRALISWLAFAFVLPVVLTGIFIAGVGIGRSHIDVDAAGGNIVRASAPDEATPPGASGGAAVGALPDFEARTGRFAPAGTPKSRR